MKEKILKFLRDSNEYISGEFLSSQLNISRNAIWKHINALKQEGYEIDSIRNKGYKLLKTPNIISTQTLTPFLTTNFIGRNLFALETVDSTNLYAKTLCKTHPVDGACIVSKIQTAGSGRFNRNWVSPIGGIWNSIILTPEINPIEAPKITLIAAVAMHNTLKDFNILTQIKWPNDLYLNGKKICGILTTMNCDMDTINYLIVGLGLNVNIPKEYFSHNNLFEATSLKSETGIEYNLADILGHFYNNFEALYLKFISNLDLSDVVFILKENLFIKTRDAYLITINKKEKVHFLDINANGELVIQDSSGNIRPVLSGEITFNI
ncbi:biotin--[acetyl-CoA-carboxylase] ligase [uncultured Clostridium sp.]|uniref:biotin--[acetyl-CoA-carboxylase] ligase n=1 Tax=uncultured Clostridium sp. TaxID=59620 RepID=UPI002629B08D|nr:biotin--[acetyl-CoA-carboxylase] ligase [uncultured Clostridium sp.]